jgi:hypothetical protein
MEKEDAFESVLEWADNEGGGIYMLGLFEDQRKNLDSFLRSLHPCWHKIQVGRCYRFCDKNNPCILVFPNRRFVSSRCCLCANEKHSQSTIWWIIYPGGKINQMCVDKQCRDKSIFCGNFQW